MTSCRNVLGESLPQMTGLCLPAKMSPQPSADDSEHLRKAVMACESMGYACATWVLGWGSDCVGNVPPTRTWRLKFASSERIKGWVAAHAYNPSTRGHLSKLDP